VADTRVRSFSEFERKQRKLGDVLDLWEHGGGDGLYVKDWHLMAELEKEGKSPRDIYEVPACFRGTLTVVFKATKNPLFR
jgi:hypothetical protein